MIKTLLLLIFSVNVAKAENLCIFFKYCNSNGNSRNSAQSVPSNSTAASLNPSNISTIKGFGVETLYQPANPLLFSLVTGNGKIGALISPNLENSFFGNRSIEIDDLTYARNLTHSQYKNKKINFALGATILDKHNYGIDLGLSVKRNPDIKNFNPGVGVSARLFALNFGAYIYQDDVKLELDSYNSPYTGTPYCITFNGPTYQEKFTVKTFTVGTRLTDLTLDFGMIKTKYKFYDKDTLIYLYSGSYNYKKMLFNLSLRKEYSQNLVFTNNMMLIEPLKEDIYFGAQYLINSHFVAGLQYNNFLMHELSATLTIFF